MTFQYKREVGFPMINQLITHYSLIDFNSVFIGNPTLESERFHNYSLRYKKFNFIKGLTVNALINYRNQSQSIKNATSLQGIDQVNSPFIFHSPENSINGLFLYSKKINIFKYTFRANGNYREYFQVINSNTDLNIIQINFCLLKIESYFKNIPNFEVSYMYNPTVYKTNLSTFNFSEGTFFINSNYRYKGLKIKVDYSKVWFTNRGIIIYHF